MSQQVRVGDTDRDQTVAALQQYTADGYLTLEEFSQRSAAAYRARTRAELNAVTQDLSPTKASHPAPRSAAADPAGKAPGGQPVTIVVTVLIALIVAGVAVMAVIMLGIGGMGGMGGMMP